MMINSSDRWCALLFTLAVSIAACGGPEGGDDGGPMDGTAPLPDGARGDGGCVLERFYADTDGDGFGDPGAIQDACVQPAGYVANMDDCDDSRADASTDSTETCNGLDDDCDTAADNGFECAAGSSTSCTTGCGSTGTGTCTDTCTPPDVAGCTPPDETCNFTIDDDCDGYIDEGVNELLTTWRGSYTAIYDAPSVGTRTNDGGAMSYWLRGSDIYAFWHETTGDWTVTGASELLIATGRPRYDAAFDGNYVAYVDAAGTAQGEIVVSSRVATTLAVYWNHRITTALPGGELYTDVRVLGHSRGPDDAFVFARHRDGFIREVHLDVTDGAETANNLLLARTDGPFAVSGNEVRWLLVTATDDATSGSAINILGGGTSGGLTRQIALDTATVPRDVAVSVDNNATPPNAVVVWSEVQRDGTGARIRYGLFLGLATTPVIGTLSDTATTPLPAPERRYITMGTRGGAFMMGVVEAPSPSSTEGTPTIYQLYPEPAVRVVQVATLPAGLHRRLALLVRGSGDAVGGARIFHNRSVDPGIAYSTIGCAP